MVSQKKEKKPFSKLNLEEEVIKVVIFLAFDNKNLLLYPSISISGRVPGTPCSKLMGAFAPVAPVPTEGLSRVRNKHTLWNKRTP